MADANVPNVVELDLRGEVCPATLLKSIGEINRRKNELRTGSTSIAILTDHRDATVTVPEMAGAMGYEAIVLKREGHYVIRVALPSGDDGPGAGTEDAKP